jgi:hypothetical protein
MYTDAPAIAYGASWSDIFWHRTHSTFVGRFFHIFLSPGFCQILIGNRGSRSALTGSKRDLRLQIGPRIAASYVLCRANSPANGKVIKIKKLEFRFRGRGTVTLREQRSGKVRM